MALPLLERYSLNQAINFIKNRTGEQLTKEDLLEYAITGRLKIGIFINVFADKLTKIGSQTSQSLALIKFDSSILHSEKYPLWGNPKSFLHKQIAGFCDGYLDIQANLLFTPNYSNNSEGLSEHINKLQNLSDEDISAYVNELKANNFKPLEVSKELKFITRDSEDEKYSKVSWLDYGNLYFKGFVYLQPYILNIIKPFVQDDEKFAIYDFDQIEFESVDFPNSEIKAYLNFELNLDNSVHLSDEEYERASFNTISINDLLIFKDDLLAFIDDSGSNLSLDNSLYLIAEMLRAIKSKRTQWTQSTLIDEILTQRQGKQITGLEQRTIEEYFSTANKRLKAQ